MNNIRQVYETIDVPICMINSEQQLVFWNQAAATTFGYAPQDVVGKPCWLVFQGSTVQGKPLCRRSCPLMAMVGKTGSAANFHMLVKKPDGALHPLQVEALTIADAQTAYLVHILHPGSASEPVFSLYLLGPIQLRHQNGSLINGTNWIDNRQQALFVYLFLNRDHIVTHHELQHQFELHLPAAELEKEITAVSQTLSRILNLPNPIVQINGGYQLTETISLWTDVDEFDKLLTQAADEPNLAQKCLLLQQAVILYRDDFLLNLPFTAKWITTWRAHFQQGYLTALQKLSALYEQADDLESAKKIYLNALKARTASTEYGRSFIHLFEDHTTPSQTLRQCKRLISLLQSELEILLEACRQPLDASDSSTDQPQEKGGE